MAATNGQLRWIHRNHQPGGKAQRLGEITQSLMNANLGPKATRVTEVVWSIGLCVDDDFRVSCSFGAMSRGVLTILVADANLVQAMRLDWLLKLRQGLAETCPRARVSEIRFECGRSEIRFPDPTGTA